MDQFVSQSQEFAKSESRNGRRCLHCGATLDEDELFCPECGEKADGEERICPVCQCSTTADYCPNCGYRIVPAICPKCGKENHSDFCEGCGTILSAQFQQMLEKPAAAVKIVEMSETEAQSIIKDFEEEKKSDEAEEFIRKVEEHKILLAEREYFKKRESRIVKVFGANPMEFQPIDLEEQAFMMKAYESLSKTVAKRDEERIRKEVEEATRKAQEQAELELKKVADHFAEISASVSQGVGAIEDEKERQRKLEEARQRKIAEEKEIQRKLEEARIKAEQIAKERSILGSYVMMYGKGNRSEIIIKSINGTRIVLEDRISFGGGGSEYKCCEGTLIGEVLEVSVLRHYATCRTDKLAEGWYKGKLSNNTIVGFWNGCSQSQYFKI